MSNERKKMSTTSTKMTGYAKLTLFMCLLLLGGVVYFIGSCINENVTERVTREIPIYNLSDSSQVVGRGSGLLSKGYIGHKRYYHYYIKNDKGDYVFQELPAEVVSIHYIKPEEKNKTPRLKEELTVYVNQDGQPSTDFPDPTNCIFYVPEGTIVEEFKLDAQ